jgi:hypothetical protein
MSEHKILIFDKGVHNLLNPEQIPLEAMQDEKNWINQDGVLRLANGKVIVGTEGAAGEIEGLHTGYKRDGTKVRFRKISTKIQYWDTTTLDWEDIIVGLTDDEEYCFANYSSLAGAFVFASGYDGLYKINTANLGSYCSMYVKATNDKGRILIDRGRMIMWACEDAAKTVLKLSYVDAQDSDVYTTVTAEASDSLGGTLAFKAGGATRNCFGVVLTLTVSGEIYVDNNDGTLTGNAGGTGTINYISGVYTISNAGVGTVDYQWEDSNDEGITDFTFDATTRVAGTGNMITQEIGGDAIESVKTGQDGAYYSLKEKSAYRLEISADDTTFTNLVYRAEMGIPYFRASTETSKGIVFMDTANPDNPKLTILTKNIYSDSVEPVVLFPHFDFSKYSYTDCCVDTYSQWIIVACQSAESDFNDTVLLCDIPNSIVDIGFYPARMFTKDAGNLYAGSPITESVYNIFDGFDDSNFVIENFAITKAETYKVENLKRYRHLKIQGSTEPDQKTEVYVSYDDSDFEKIGTIDGRADYVDAGSPRVVGGNMAGVIPIGGDNTTTVYPFFYDLKISTPKFRKREIKFVATAMGYIEISSILEEDILLFENRIPRRFRIKKI